MMQNTLDVNSLTFHSVENAMAAKHLAANALSIIGSRLSSEGHIGKHSKDFVHSTRVFVSDFVTELLGAVSIDPGQIASRRCTELDFSHAARGAWR